MKQLTGLDATFLYMETPNSFGHVSSLSVYERPSDPTYKPYEAFRAQVEARLHLLEPFRRRLVEVPLALDHPYWIRDPDFDLDFHIRHMALPAPGNAEQLGEQVARIVGRPMDRTRPLWEVYVIEGIDGGEFGVLTKVHHATIDGASGVELLTILLDTTPEGDPVPPTTEVWKAEQIPTPLQLLNRTAINLASRPEKVVRLHLRLLRDLATVTRSKGLATMVVAVRSVLPQSRGAEPRDQAQAMPNRAAPATPFNKSITAHRRFAFRSTPLDDIKFIKNHLGATVNDVVMAVCAGALRRYLQEHDALTEDPLVAMVPVSIRTGAEEDRWTNRVSGLMSRVPTHLPDPIERVAAVHEAMIVAKENFDLIPADVLVDLTQFSPPALATRAIRMAAAMKIADRLNPPINLVISNVPGPREPLYLAGAMLKHYYPVSIVLDGQGLNITVQSYLDSLDFGLVACRELVPDLWHLVDLCIEEVAVLRAACEPAPAPVKRKGPAPRRRITAKQTHS